MKTWSFNRFTPGARRVLCLVALLAVGLRASGQDTGLRRGPYLQAVTPTGVTVVWETWTPSTGSLRYHGAGAPTTIEIPIPTPAEHHEVTLDGLAPYTEYQYQLIDANGRALTGKIPFRSARQPGDAEAFTFAVIGDTRSQIPPHRDVVAQAAAARPDFVLHTGDMVGDGHGWALWDLFFEIEQPLIQSAPLFGALGNHENMADDYFRAFVLPGGERWYAFSYGSARFICLQIDGLGAFMPGSEQYAWLETELTSAAAQEAAWRVVYFHMPPFTSVGQEGYEAPLRETLVPIFERMGVDVVFCGHKHNYERNVVGGITYIISGGGGAPLYAMGAQESTMQRFVMDYHYVLVEADGESLRGTMIDRAGEVRDTFALP